MNNRYTKEQQVVLWLMGLALFAFLVVCLVLIATNDTNDGQTYTMECYVMECDNDSDLIVMVDFATENEWVWEGIDNLNLGDVVEVTMNDNGTEDITDDVMLTLDRAC